MRDSTDGMQHTLLALLKTSVITCNCAGKQHTLLALLKTSKITIKLKVPFAEGSKIQLHRKATHSPGSYLRNSTDGMQHTVLAFLKTTVTTFNCSGKQQTLLALLKTSKITIKLKILFAEGFNV